LRSERIKKEKQQKKNPTKCVHNVKTSYANLNKGLMEGQGSHNPGL